MLHAFSPPSKFVINALGLLDKTPLDFRKIECNLFLDFKRILIGYHFVSDFVSVMQEERRSCGCVFSHIVSSDFAALKYVPEETTEV